MQVYVFPLKISCWIRLKINHSEDPAILHRHINPYQKTLTAQTVGNTPPIVARVFRSIRSLIGYGNYLNDMYICIYIYIYIWGIILLLAPVVQRKSTVRKYIYIYIYIYMGVSILYLSNIIEQELPLRKKGPRFINELDNSRN